MTNIIIKEKKSDFDSKKIAFLILLLSNLIIVFCRIRLLDVPLERDEGEYAYAGQQLLQSIPPFVSIYHFKLPGMYFIYATIFSLFGQTIKSIHLGLLLVNLLTISVLFFVAKRFFNSIHSAIVSAIFGFLTLSQTMHGFTANAEHFVLLFVLLGIWFLIKAIESVSSKTFKKSIFYFFLSGLFLGISYTIKQQAIFFVAFGLFYTIYKFWREKSISKKLFFQIFSTWVFGLLLPLSIICIWFYHIGLFEKFWWWTWDYPRNYITQVSLEVGKGNLFSSMIPIAKSFYFVFLIIIIGLIFSTNLKSDKRIFSLSLFFFSLFSVSIGLYFYQHYFILLAPSLAFLFAMGITAIENYFHKNKISVLKNNLPIILFLITTLFFVLNEKKYLFKLSGHSISRTTFGANPFPESIEIAKFIKDNSTLDDKIAILGSEPQIFFYSNRKSATGYIYTYEMMNQHSFSHQFQVEMAKEIELSKPKYIVYNKNISSWFSTPKTEFDYYIFQWAEQYLQENYIQKGIVNILWPQNEYADFCWRNPNTQCNIYSSIWIGIYQRK